MFTNLPTPAMLVDDMLGAGTVAMATDAASSLRDVLEDLRRLLASPGGQAIARYWQAYEAGLSELVHPDALRQVSAPFDQALLLIVDTLCQLDPSIADGRTLTEDERRSAEQSVCGGTVAVLVP